MNKKTKTYVLLVLVLGIWGTIGYKIIAGLQPHIPEQKENELKASFIPLEKEEMDTFSIQKVERDPFLGSLVKKHSKKRTSRTPKLNQNKSINTPIIEYLGLIKNQNSSKQVFVVNLNNDQYLFKKGQEINGVNLLNGNSKEIAIRANDKTQKIKLKK